MKSLFLRSGAALACALTLASCGGSGGSLSLGGVVYGLTRDGLVLQNNGGADLVVAANSTSFIFPDLIAFDTGFNVTVKSSPPSSVCTPTSNKGTTGTYNITTVVISCVTDSFALGGSVSGLTGSGLILINGPDRIAVPAGASSFALSKVAFAAPYGITVLTQPSNQTCSVTNGTGTMAAAAVNNVQVSCI